MVCPSNSALPGSRISHRAVKSGSGNRNCGRCSRFELLSSNIVFSFPDSSYAALEERRRSEIHTR